MDGFQSPTRTLAAPGAAPERPGALLEQSVLLLVFGLFLPGLIVYALATTNEARVLAVILGVVVATAIVGRPFYGLLLFVALLYLRVEETIPALQGLRLPLGISVITLAGMLLQLAVNRERLARSPLLGMVCGFAAVAVLSAVRVNNVSGAAQDLLKLVILVVLVLNLVKDRHRLALMVTTLLGFTGYLAVYSIYLYHSGGAMEYQGEILRSQATGIFNDPNDLAATIVAGLALALVRARSARGWGRFAYGGLALVMLWAILLTNSRGGMLALLTVIGTFTLVTLKNKTTAVVLGGLAVAVLLVAGPSRMTSFDSGEESANSRFWFWDNGVQQLLAHPLTGVGYGGFPDVNNGMTAHNSFVLCFAETGVPGYFFWMGCFYYCFRRTGRRLPEDTSPHAAEALPADYHFGSRLALAGYLVACFWISRTYVPVLYLLISLPIAAELVDPAARARAARRSLPREWGVILLLALGSIVGISMLARKLM